MRILPFPVRGAVSSDVSLQTTAEAVNFTLDAFGRVVSVDEVWIALVGLTLAEFAAGLWVDRIHPEDAAPAMRRYFKALSEGRPLTLSNRFRIASGDYINLSLRAVPFLDLKGRILHWRGVIAYRAAEIDDAGRATFQIS
jgi:PAS domain-containing protein